VHALAELRLLFSVLVGALSATACICADLNDPFRGAFQITPSSEQLITIREMIGQEICVDGELSGRTSDAALSQKAQHSS
jgi:hypothetical protein